eukprot:m.231249 g.231249  ORF g.231249 m.231249 type:complete len:118 (+) comp19266_c1_seq6:1248-1601(+)
MNPHKIIVVTSSYHVCTFAPMWLVTDVTSQVFHCIEFALSLQPCECLTCAGGCCIAAKAAVDNDDEDGAPGVDNDADATGTDADTGSASGGSAIRSNDKTGDAGKDPNAGDSKGVPD